MRRAAPRARESRASNEHLARPRKARSWYKRCPFCGRSRRKQLYDKRRSVANWEHVRIIPRAPGVILAGQCCRICHKRLEDDKSGTFFLELDCNGMKLRWDAEARAYWAAPIDCSS